MKIVFVTGNEDKLKEVRRMVGSDLEIIAQSIDLPEYQGEPLDIAAQKCRMAYEIVQVPVIVEDTSLCYNALGGLPGPYIKWFLEKLGSSGLFKLLEGFEDKSAYAQCVFAYYDGATMSHPEIFDGRCPGRIVAPRGPPKFGWNPIFEPEGYSETFAEMDDTVKNSISHRSVAFAKLKAYFLSQRE